MQVSVNGRSETIASLTIAELVKIKGLDPQRLVVELNRSIVPQGQWTRIELREGDALELLSFVGGG